MDPLSGSDLMEPSGVLMWKPEGQANGGKSGCSESTHFGI